MMAEDRVSAFINSLDRGNTDFLNGIEDECRRTNVPVIRPQMQSLLKLLLARENFRRAGKEKAITLLEGDAAKILGELKEPYDFIFMDAAKGQYLGFLPDILRLLRTGGLLVSDNVLQDGDIIESRFAVTRRNRTIHSRMREYLYELKHNGQLETAVLQVGDGAAVSVKTGGC